MAKTQFPPLEEQLEVISRGAVEITPLEELKTKLQRSLETGKPLRIKQGFDPTAPDIHLGHTVGLRKLRQFQELGHQIVIIIGDYTGMIGDPSERSTTRPRLSHEVVMENARTYQKQFFKILDPEKTEIRYNGEWFSRMSFAEIMELASRITVARLLERDDFTKRMAENKPISLQELFYPLMQAYDSVMVRADVEIGATEQKFNLLVGRDIQNSFGQEPQVILTLPVLVGTDGVQRMSKSTGNYIGIDEPPLNMYKKIMRLNDEQIYPYFELVTDVSLDELRKIKQQLEDPQVNPKDVKHELAFRLVQMYHSLTAAKKAREDYIREVEHGEIPENIPTYPVPKGRHRLIDIMAASQLVPSKSVARQLIRQRAVWLDGEIITNELLEIEVTRPLVLRAGRGKYIRLVPAE